MSQFEVSTVHSMLDAADAMSGADAKGKKYEELLQYLFECVPGTVVVRNQRSYFGAEQVDLGVSHSGAFPGVPGEFLVECKNYDHVVDSKAVGYFLFICISRKSRLAVVAAASGLSGDPEETSFAHSLAQAAMALDCRLVLITTADIRSLTSVDDLVDLISKRYLHAFVNGGVGASH